MTRETPEKRAEKPEPDRGRYGRKPMDPAGEASNVTAGTEPDYPEDEGWLDAVVERENMIRALKRVQGNKGAPGIDGMTVEELEPYLKAHWARIKAELLEGRYRPQAVRGVEIPKPDGGVRKLGIPTAVDRLIGQAVHQVMAPAWDRTFSEASYGFRPGRSALQAVQAARGYVTEGFRWVVDIDLEKFFDRVNHDVLMALVARRVKDKRLLGLLRRFLQAGLMTDGPETVRMEGTPQGSPLSPLLSNILLDVLDKELERRGHRFCRYADDCNIYVRSKRAGERVMATVTRFLEKRLHLRVNPTKSAVGRPWDLKFLGYSITSERSPRLRVARRSEKRLRESLRLIFRQGRGRNIRRLIATLNVKLRGWFQYFRLSEVRIVFETLDAWLRRKLRCVLWRQWKRPATRRRKLMQRGLDQNRAWKSASNGRGAWWNAGASHMNEAYQKAAFTRLGLVSLLDSFLGARATS
jgi:RNA-directed DNA polymerase